MLSDMVIKTAYETIKDSLEWAYNSPTNTAYDKTDKNDLYYYISGVVDLTDNLIKKLDNKTSCAHTSENKSERDKGYDEECYDDWLEFN